MFLRVTGQNRILPNGIELGFGRPAALCGYVAQYLFILKIVFNTLSSDSILLKTVGLLQYWLV